MKKVGWDLRAPEPVEAISRARKARPTRVEAARQGAAHEGAEIPDRVVDDPVADEQSVLSPTQDALVREQRQVLARVGLAGPRGGAELLDALLSLEEGLEELEPGRVAQGPEPLGHELERLSRERRLPGAALPSAAAEFLAGHEPSVRTLLDENRRVNA